MLLRFQNSKAQKVVLRFALIIPLFYLAHAFSWPLLRAWITTAIIEGDALLGTHLVQLSPTSFSVGVHYFQVVTSCTSIDALLGSLPLLFDRRKPLLRFLRFFLLYALVAEGLNLLRLILGFFAYDHGISWRFAHEIPGGVFLFMWFLWLLRYRGWVLPKVQQAN